MGIRNFWKRLSLQAGFVRETRMNTRKLWKLLCLGACFVAAAACNAGRVAGVPPPGSCLVGEVGACPKGSICLGQEGGWGRCEKDHIPHRVDFLEVVPDNIVFDSEEAGEKTLEVRTELAWSIHCGGCEGGFHWEPGSGSGSGRLTVYASENSSGLSRHATLSVTAGALSATVSVLQPANCVAEAEEAVRNRTAQTGKVCGWVSTQDNCGNPRLIQQGTSACTGLTPQCDGAVNMCLADNQSPSNNACPGFAMTRGVPVYGNTRYASGNYGNTLSAACLLMAWDEALGRELVYSYTPGADGTFIAQLTPSGYAALLWMTEGSCGGNGSACVDAVTSAGGSNHVAQLLVDGKAGTTYYFHVDALDDATFGEFSFEIQTADLEAAVAFCQYMAYVQAWNDTYDDSLPQDVKDSLNSNGGAEHYAALLAHYSATPPLPDFFRFQFDSSQGALFVYWVEKFKPGLLYAGVDVAALDAQCQ